MSIKIGRKEEQYYVPYIDGFNRKKWVAIMGYPVTYKDYHFFYYKQGDLFILCHAGSGDIISVEYSRKEMVESLMEFIDRKNSKSILASIMRDTYRSIGRNPKYC